MGCASSKQPICRKCKEPCTPVRRSYSMHHRPERKGDAYHVVALTSSTLGSLNSFNQNPPIKENSDEENRGIEKVEDNRRKEFSLGMIEAKTWSKMIDEKIPKMVPKTPVRTPTGEPETINAWELMEGLEDTSPLRPPHQLRSFSFNVAPDSVPSSNPKPTWFEMAENESNSHSNSTSIVSEFDPDVISQFRKSLEDLPPANPFYLKPLELTEVKEANVDFKVYKCKTQVLLYFTSLRGVRKTYEDCCHVRVILKGTGVRVDERDVSMHLGFKEELKELMGDGFSGGGLPRVFVGEKYIGGVEEIRKLHEDGQLEKVLEGCEMVEEGGCGGGGGGVCEACGDVRFVPCETCSGSCKVYYEDEYEQEEECDDNDYGFQRCPDCNENGIIRCPICCDH